MESMLAMSYHCPHVPQSANKGISPDLDWWPSVLIRPTLSRSIPLPTRPLNVNTFSDVSSGVRITIIVHGRWRAWRLIPGWKTLWGQRDIGWAKAVGFECLVHYLCNSHPDGRHFVVHDNNHGVVEGWQNGRSWNSTINTVFRQLHSLFGIDDPQHSFHPVYIPSGSNPADSPSRGIYPPVTRLLPAISLPAELDNFLICSQSPPTPTEWQLLQEGCCQMHHQY